MGQVKNMLIGIADEATEITLANCKSSLKYFFPVVDVDELKSEVEDIAWDAYQTVFFEHVNSTLSWDDLKIDDEVLTREFDSFWNNFWRWNHENLIKSYGFEL